MIRTISAVSLLGLMIAGASCASSGSSSEAGPAPTIASSNAVELGRFTFTFDPTAAPGHQLTVAPIGLDQRSSEGGLGAARQAVVITSTADLTSTTSYSTSTHLLTATIYLRNLSDATNNWDEPTMTVSSVTATGGTTITFNQVDTNSCTGCGTTSGAVYAFADIEKSGGTTVWAKRQLTITDSLDKSFNFTVSIAASTTTSTVSPDKDHDGYNSETGLSGSDCNDNDATKYPGGGTCTCATTCSSCASSGNCCKPTSAQDCTVSGCTCTESLNSGFISCSAGTVCEITDVGTGSSDVGITTCTNAQCGLTCPQNAKTAKCNIGTCDGGTCTLNGTGNNSSVSIDHCKNGATCVVACSNSETCNLTCDDAASSCTITGCTGSTTCTLTCPGTITTCSDGRKFCGSGSC